MCESRRFCRYLGTQPPVSVSQMTGYLAERHEGNLFYLQSMQDLCVLLYKLARGTDLV